MNIPVSVLVVVWGGGKWKDWWRKWRVNIGTTASKSWQTLSVCNDLVMQLHCLAGSSLQYRSEEVDLQVFKHDT